MTTRHISEGLILGIALVSFLTVSILAPPVLFAADIAPQSDWCGTQSIFEAQTRARGAETASNAGECPPNGECDIPNVRNGYVSSGRLKVVHLFFQVMCYDDGSNPAALASDVAAQVDTLNSNYSQTGFRFEYDLRFINSTKHRFLLSFADAEQMKSLYAVEPEKQLNIFVTTNAFCFCSYATYPWSPAALTARGGIVMTRERFYPQSKSASSLSHEVGHCLGLFHTQRGVTEVPLCGSCYEAADATDRDFSGDFCSDTDPSPSITTCTPTESVDKCSGRTWNTSSYRNYMGYAPDQCLSEFSSQQIARMHCWTESHLSSITRTVVPTDTLFGTAPFTADFASKYNRPATQWRWNFGDGNTSNEQSPVHTFTRAGVFDISCTVVTESGEFPVDSLPRVYVTGDTLTVASKVADTNESARIDISITNRVPLTHLVIPISWDGPFGLTFDSISTSGLRTRQMTVENGGIFLTDIQPQFNRITIVVNVDSAHSIPPGSGRILSLYIHTPSVMYSGDNAIQIIGYDANFPTLSTIPGDYTPYIVNGTLSLGCCEGLVGNVDDDPDENVDVSDLSLLVLNLFVNFQPLPCSREANIDSDPDGVVDIADLTRLIDYLYISFAPPAACQ